MHKALDGGRFIGKIVKKIIQQLQTATKEGKEHTRKGYTAVESKNRKSYAEKGYMIPKSNVRKNHTKRMTWQRELQNTPEGSTMEKASKHARKKTWHRRASEYAGRMGEILNTKKTSEREKAKSYIQMARRIEVL